jgi:hypothetical protein
MTEWSRFRTVQYTVYQTTTTFNISTRISTAMGRPMLCLEPLCNATLQHESAPLFLLTSHTPTIHVSWTIHTIHINNLCYSSPPGVTYIPHIHSLFHGHIQRGSRRQTRRQVSLHMSRYSIQYGTKYKPQTTKPQTTNPGPKHPDEWHSC